MTEAERLSKRLIQLTSCSRREAELYIEGGWVTVNGQEYLTSQLFFDDVLVHAAPVPTFIDLGRRTEDRIRMLADLRSGRARQWTRDVVFRMRDRNGAAP